MKGICTGLLLVGLAGVLAGCSGQSKTSAGDPLALQDEPAAVCPVTEASDRSAKPSALVQYGFAIRDFRVIRDEYRRVHAIGEIENVGEATHGVELQAALRDADGRLVAVGHFCPASGNNIAPGETWPFTYSFGRQEEAICGELRIVDVFRSMSGVW